jgi:hypothetical protein
VRGFHVLKKEQFITEWKLSSAVCSSCRSIRRILEKEYVLLAIEKQNYVLIATGYHSKRSILRDVKCVCGEKMHASDAFKLVFVTSM